MLNRQITPARAAQLRTQATRWRATAAQARDEGNESDARKCDRLAARAERKAG